MTRRGVGPDPLRVSTDAFYWKPGTAWFRALEVAEYERLDVHLNAPALDFGCGDGRVAWMLRELGRLGPNPVGTDYSAGQLHHARQLGVHAELVRSDGGRLPFADAAFRSILCNGVLCSIPGDFRPAIREIRRVLAPGGRVVITVPTDRFNDVLLWPRVLGSLSPAWRARYESAMDARQPHFWKLAPDEWRRELEAAGLRVTAVQPFVGREAGARYNILAMHLFRFLGPLRMLDHLGGRRVLGPALRRLLRRGFSRTELGPRPSADEAGYVLLEARR